MGKLFFTSKMNASLWIIYSFENCNLSCQKRFITINRTIIFSMCILKFIKIGIMYLLLVNISLQILRFFSPWWKSFRDIVERMCSERSLRWGASIRFIIMPSIHTYQIKQQIILSLLGLGRNWKIIIFGLME